MRVLLMLLLGGLVTFTATLLVNDAPDAACEGLHRMAAGQGYDLLRLA